MFSDVLLTVDFDRTLTGPDSVIPQRNLEAIRWFIENGGAFTVNTGRSLPMALPFKDIVPVNAPLLLYNGAAAYDVQKEEIVFAQEIQLDMWKTVEEMIELFPDLVVEIQALDKHYNFVHDDGWDAFSANNCPYATAQVGQDLGPFLKLTVYGRIWDVTVAHMFVGTPEELQRMDEAEELLNRRYGDKLAVFRAAPRVIDMQAKGVSKGIAARRLLEQMGRKILVCVGDGENDIVMLDDADYSFVPSDAILRERYENVCPCGEGAVADVIYEKIPQILKRISK